MDQLKYYLKDPYTYIENVTTKDLVRLLKIANDKYRNHSSIMTDDQYDLLLDTLKEKSPKNPFLQQIGAPVLNKVKLPYHMGSMDKLKPNNITELEKWKDNFEGPYYLSDKLDGVSALYVVEDNQAKLYTRGDGINGTDITHLLKYINVPIIHEIAVRGELIISKEAFKKYQNKMANPRNMVAGLVNSKTINSKIIKDIDFVAYEIIEPWLPFKKQFDFLIKNNFITVYNESKKDINMDMLSKYYKIRKISNNYEIDGIIVSYSNPKDRSGSGNPDYAFAFKETTDSVIVKVEDCLWNETKDGYFKPRLKLEPTKLSGVTITYVTAFNAKYVVDNNLGPGAEIKLIRSGEVIPHILEIIKPGKVIMPTVKYNWTDTKVDIKVDNQSDEGLINELVNFVKKLNIKNIDKSKITTLVDNGIDNFVAIITLEEDDLIDIFKEKTIQNILLEIDYAVNNMTLLDFMVACNIARGLGEKKLMKIIEKKNIIKEYYNKKITDDELFEYLNELDGFDIKTSELFVSNLPKFIDILNDLPKQIRTKLLNYKVNIVSNKFKDMIIVFSGFRNKEWEKIIVENSGKVTTSISSNTTLLVIKDGETNTSKINKAKEFNINILNQTKFINKYNL
jgi:NAD-dependent DNA ligase